MLDLIRHLFYLAKILKDSETGSERHLKKYQVNRIGNFLILLPVAEKIALQTAGVHGGTPTSPTPPTGKSFLI
jgi:hypothetical protein